MKRSKRVSLVRLYPVNGSYVERLRDKAAELLRIADQMERQGFDQRRAS